LSKETYTQIPRGGGKREIDRLRVELAAANASNAAFHTLLGDADRADVETVASLLHTIALIREAAGCGGEVMLADLPAFVCGLRDQRDEAQRIACDADAAYRMNGWSDQQYHPSLARQIATERGWNCFTEEEKR
jgi:hypothetical protein